MSKMFNYRRENVLDLEKEKCMHLHINLFSGNNGINSQTLIMFKGEDLLVNSAKQNNVFPNGFLNLLDHYPTKFNLRKFVKAVYNLNTTKIQINLKRK